MKDKVDLFAILDTTLDDYKKKKANVDKLYKKKAPKFHPDKFPDGQPADIKVSWDNLMAAKHILADANKAAVYIKWYEKQTPPTVAKNPASQFHKPVAAESSDAPTPLATAKTAPSEHRPERKRKVIGRNM